MFSYIWEFHCVNYTIRPSYLAVSANFVQIWLLKLLSVFNLSSNLVTTQALIILFWKFKVRLKVHSGAYFVMQRCHGQICASKTKCKQDFIWTYFQVQICKKQKVAPRVKSQQNEASSSNCYNSTVYNSSLILHTLGYTCQDNRSLQLGIMFLF